jgi:hypothetical protein
MTRKRSVNRGVGVVGAAQQRGTAKWRKQRANPSRTSSETGPGSLEAPYATGAISRPQCSQNFVVLRIGSSHHGQSGTIVFSALHFGQL